MPDLRHGFRRWVLVFGLAAVIRLLYWTDIRGTVLDRWHEWDQTDMHTYLEQGRRIAAGDWLGRDPFHPYHAWQRDAPPEKWIGWYPPNSFHQAPGYSYFLAAAQIFGSRQIPFVKLLQILMGGLTAVFLHEAARKLDGPLAGWIAGFVAAVYGPLIQMELQLLRDGPAAMLLAAILMLLLRHVDSISAAEDRARSRWRMGGIGAAIGLLTLVHETGQVAFVAALVSMAWVYFRSVPGMKPNRVRCVIALACLAGGFAVGLSPLVLRNLAVGSPVLTISSRSALVFAMSNHALAEDGGRRWGVGGKELIQIMDEAEESASGVVGAVVRSYSGRIGLLPRNLWLKFRSVCAVHEAPDNTSYDFYRLRSWVLWAMPGWWLVFAPGIAGLGILISRGRREDKSAAGQSVIIRNQAMVFLVFVAAYFGALSITHSIGRLRLCVVPVLIPLAGVFVAEVIRSARGGGWWRISELLSGSFVFAILLQLHAQLSLEPIQLRGADYYVAAGFELREGELDHAAQDLAEAVRLGIRNPGVYRMLGEVLRALGREAEAAEWFDRAESHQKSLDDPGQSH